MINHKGKWLKTLLIIIMIIIKLIYKILKNTLISNLHFKWHFKKHTRVINEQINCIKTKEFNIKVYIHQTMHEKVIQLGTIIYLPTKVQQIRYCKLSDYKEFFGQMSFEQRIYLITTLCHQIILLHMSFKNLIEQVKMVF
jgi:hypothetical protein